MIAEGRDYLHYPRPGETLALQVRTSSGDQFLIVDDGYRNDKLFIFGTDNNMKLLCDSYTIHVNGTCPNIFYQIFTIHAMKFVTRCFHCTVFRTCKVCSFNNYLTFF